jgi:FAD/FMN-containing dehydrogenase
MAHEDLVKAVAADRVFYDEKTLQVYASDESGASGLPFAVVKVTSAEEVQKLIELAKERNIPLIPVSSPGGPRFRGDTIPSQGGVVLDLSGMNRILNIDRKDRIALIEPGVTFEQFETALRPQGLRALKPLMPRKTKSVLASCLEREPIVVPRDHWDSIDPLVTTEVVFGTGDLFRTGSAAGPPAGLKEQLELGLRQVFASGPGSTSLSRVVQGAQGTMGIVTWGSIVCGILPEMMKTFFLAADTLDRLIDVSYAFSRRRFGEEHFLVNAFQFATMMAKRDGIKTLSEALPPWVLVLNLTASGMLPEKRMDYQEHDLREIAQAGGVEVRSSVAGVSGTTLMKTLDNPPDEFYKMRYKGSFRDIFFTTTLDKTPGHIALLYETAKGRCPTTEIGVYLQPIVQGSSCHCEFNLPCEPSKKAALEPLCLDASTRLAHNGAFFSRPYGPWADLAFGMNGDATALLKKVKKMLDPEGIMNPGKLCF